jgi:hypothetical protein
MHLLKAVCKVGRGALLNTSLMLTYLCYQHHYQRKSEGKWLTTPHWNKSFVGREVAATHLALLLMIVSSYEQMPETIAEATHVFNLQILQTLTLGESKPGGL